MCPASYFNRPEPNCITLGGREFPKVTWWKRKNLRNLYLLLLIPLVGSWAEGYDGSMMNALQTSTQWQNFFGHPRGSLLAFYNLSFAIGALAAVIPFPWGAYFADKIGRRWGIVCGNVVTIIGTILQAASQNFPMFVIARVLLGMGVTISQSNCPLLVTELAHTQHRARITAMYNANWYFGSIIAAWVTFGTININSSWAWRIPSLLQGAAAIIQITMIWFVPESPRYLINKDRHDEALRILKKYHGEGVMTDFVAAEFLEIKETIALEKEYSQRGWAELLRTPGNRKRALICYLQGFFSQWCGNGLISYYLVPVLDTIGISNSNEQAGLNGGLQIWNFIVAIWAAFNIDRIGRRPMVLFSTGSMIVIFTLWTVFSALYVQNENSGMAKGVIVMIFFFYTAFNCGWQGLVVAYPVEILPYELRAKGLQLTFFGISSNVVNQYVNPVGIQNAGWKFYIGVPLEEIAKLFDGEDAKVGGTAASTQAKEHLRDMKERGLAEHTEVVVEYTRDLETGGGT
ncbi:hexose transporter protein [Penicillium riverlandense]|uniref:hexose transporter protein n=1 Tax=Penicillium riverlandense TaxID=1903569 RepID=UPI00254902DF|nr:hexose transporter protein [Penicillium riverlandense]KAJ5812454.1 hexose transporter protein [Penicillium riverlandense]